MRSMDERSNWGISHRAAQQNMGGNNRRIYIWPQLTKSALLPNTPSRTAYRYGEEKGMWVEVTQPFVQLGIRKSFPRSPWLQNVSSTRWRLYYGQVIWCDGIRTGQMGRSNIISSRNMDMIHFGQMQQLSATH